MAHLCCLPKENYKKKLPEVDQKLVAISNCMYKVKAPAAAAEVGTLEPDDNKDHRSETSPSPAPLPQRPRDCLLHGYVRNNHQISCQLAAEAEMMLDNISWGQKQQLNYIFALTSFNFRHTFVFWLLHRQSTVQAVCILYVSYSLQHT